VGAKSSVCRDFAVLGYCEKGIDCEEAHIRECPYFAETGSCKNPKCKLPHVIRANRKRFGAAVKQLGPTSKPEATADRAPNQNEAHIPSTDQNIDPPRLPTNGVNYTFEGGDEYIPLTFVESEEDEDTQTSDDEDEDEEEEEAEDVKVFA